MDVEACPPPFLIGNEENIVKEKMSLQKCQRRHPHYNRREISIDEVCPPLIHHYCLLKILKHIVRNCLNISNKPARQPFFLPVTCWRVVWLLMSQISFYSWKFFWKDSYSRFFWGCDSKLCMGYAVEVLTTVSFFSFFLSRGERSGGWPTSCTDLPDETGLLLVLFSPSQGGWR